MQGMRAWLALHNHSTPFEKAAPDQAEVLFKSLGGFSQLFSEYISDKGVPVSLSHAFCTINEVADIFLFSDFFVDHFIDLSIYSTIGSISIYLLGVRPA